MLTDNLIKLIHEGKAEYKTYTLGVSGTGFIQVPKNHYIVITDFIYNHFVDTDAENINTMALANGLSYNALHTVVFSSSPKSQYMWDFRTNIQIFPFFDIETQAQDFNFFSVLNDAENINCYQVHNDNINISIFRFNTLKEWSITMGLNSDKSNSSVLPMGYGNPTQGGIDTVQEVRLSPGGAQYLPLSDIGSIAPDSALYKNQFRDDISETTALNPPAQSLEVSGIYTFPVINISYVLVKIPFVNKNE